MYTLNPKGCAVCACVCVIYIYIQVCVCVNKVNSKNFVKLKVTVKVLVISNH